MDVGGRCYKKKRKTESEPLMEPRRNAITFGDMNKRGGYKIILGAQKRGHDRFGQGRTTVSFLKSKERKGQQLNSKRLRA